jgi:hypothetical protein
LPDGSRYAVSVAELWADGQAGEEVIARARDEAKAGTDAARVTGRQIFAQLLIAESGDPLYTHSADELAKLRENSAQQTQMVHVAWATCGAIAQLPSPYEFRRAVQLLDGVAAANLLREIFGNPFRRVAFDTAWRTSTAVAIASGMYESREFSAMPILADALQDAGCENADILNHCRDPQQVHVRGCWVVDLVLDKA